MRDVASCPWVSPTKWLLCGLKWHTTENQHILHILYIICFKHFQYCFHYLIMWKTSQLAALQKFGHFQGTILKMLLLLAVMVCVIFMVQTEFHLEEIHSLRIRLVCPPHPWIREGMEEGLNGLEIWCSVLLDMKASIQQITSWSYCDPGLCNSSV